MTFQSFAVFRSFGLTLLRFDLSVLRFDSASLCVGFKGIAYFDALVIDLEEVADFSCDMTSLGK